MRNRHYKRITSRLRLPLKVLQCRLTGVYKPLVVLFYVTDRCNLRCKYCVGNWSARKIVDLTTQEIMRIIRECQALGTCHFTIHGGEILLRPDIGEIVNYLKESGLFVNLVTNGILLPERIEEIMKIDSLCISLDGREENNDFNRGEGSYRAAMKAIKIAKERNMSLAVHATLTNRNIGDIEYLCRQAKRFGYYQQFSLLLKPLTPSQQELGLSDQESREALSEIIRLKKRGYPVFTSYRTLRNALEWPYSFHRARLDRNEIGRKSKLIRCFYGKLKIAIDADGFAYPCSSLNDTFKGLNVREVGVKRAYEHVLKSNTCEACFYLTQNDWSLLLGGCLEQYLNQSYMQLRSIFGMY